MKVIDAHLHLDDRHDSCVAAVDALISEMDAAGVHRGVLLQLATQPWSVAEVAAAVAAAPQLCVFANIDPTHPDAAEQLQAAAALGYSGLKLHPRLQGYAVADLRVAALVRRAGELQLPVVIDAFPDGDWLMQGQSPLDYARLCKQCPDARIVVAHMGGHLVLDMLMLAKRVPNMYFDLSFSLLYYRGSSVPADMVYAMGSLRHERVFYGSDYPDRGVAETLEASVQLLQRCGLVGRAAEKIMFDNAREFFCWRD